MAMSVLALAFPEQGERVPFHVLGRSIALRRLSGSHRYQVKVFEIRQYT
jgi:hypothetical protein